MSILEEALQFRLLRKGLRMNKYGGYGKYYSEFDRLKQGQLMTDEWSERQLETVNKPTKGIKYGMVKRRRGQLNETNPIRDDRTEVLPTKTN